MSLQPTVILVCHQDEAREDLRSTLEEEHYDVIEKESCSEAWSFLRDHTDVPFVILPSDDEELNGYEVTHLIRTHRRKHHPFILLLHPEEESCAHLRSLRLGADGSLTYPFDEELFHAYLIAARRHRQIQPEEGQLPHFLSICAYCKKVRTENEQWKDLEQFIGDETGSKLSHGICPSCYEEKIIPRKETSVP